MARARPMLISAAHRIAAANAATIMQRASMSLLAIFFFEFVDVLLCEVADADVFDDLG